MAQQTLSVGQATTARAQTQSKRLSGSRQRVVVDNARIIMTDVAVDTAKMIDVICCGFGEVVDWRYYRPSTMSGGLGEIIRFALTENEKGLHAGGYIELSVLPEEEAISVNSGYYDTYHQPTVVCRKSLPLGKMNHPKLAQALMEIYDGVIRECRAH